MRGAIPPPQLVFMALFLTKNEQEDKMENKIDEPEQAGLGVTPYICVRKVLGSNVGRDSSYPECFRGLLQSLQANAGIIPQL
jgi:hypothetical protein